MSTTFDSPSGDAPIAARESASLDADRVVRAPLAAVRQELLTALSRSGFKITAQQLTVLEARRGSLMAGTFSPRHTPISVAVALDSVGACCRVHTHLSHPASVLQGTSRGADPLVTQLLGEVQQTVDAALAHLDADAAERFGAPVSRGEAGDPAAADGSAVIPTLDQQAVAKVSQALAGTSTRGLPDAWRQHEGLLLRAPQQIAYLNLADAQAHLAVAAMVIAQPESLPPELSRELEQLAVRIEHSLDVAATPLVEVEVTDHERKAVDFLHLQVRIRSRLPVRTLQRCRDCRFEKVTNPDLAKLMQHNKRLRSLTSAFGATFWRGGISPFVLVGTLFQLKGLDPDYVCPRCQGVSAEPTLVTFCPGCGDLCKDAVLRLCPKCKHDYRAGFENLDELWVDPPELVAATLAVGTPVTGAGGGALCRTCGGEFTALWRIVVLGPNGALEEWFVCGTTPACGPPSLTAPVQVAAPTHATTSTTPPWPPPG